MFGHGISSSAPKDERHAETTVRMTSHGGKVLTWQQAAETLGPFPSQFTEGIDLEVATKTVADMEKRLGPMPKSGPQLQMLSHLALASTEMRLNGEAIPPPLQELFGDIVADLRDPEGLPLNGKEHILTTVGVLFTEALIAHFGIDPRLASVMAKSSCALAARIHGIDLDKEVNG